MLDTDGNVSWLVLGGAFDIICIQESYIADADKEMWEREWEGSLFYTSVTAHSMGQIILVRKNFPFDVQCLFVFLQK